LGKSWWRPAACAENIEEIFGMSKQGAAHKFFARVFHTQIRPEGYIEI